MAGIQDERWMEVQKARIKEAFALFDKEKKALWQGIDQNVAPIISNREKMVHKSFHISKGYRSQTHPGCVIQEEVSTIMRFLGAYPTEKAMVKDILPDMQEDEPTNYVTYSRFEEKMLEILASRAWEPDTSEVLLQAFRAIDDEELGYIDTARMAELLMTKGTPFREKEMDSFMTVAKDIETGHIYYEDYVVNLNAEA